MNKKYKIKEKIKQLIKETQRKNKEHGVNLCGLRHSFEFTPITEGSSGTHKPIKNSCIKHFGSEATEIANFHTHPVHRIKDSEGKGWAIPYNIDFSYSDISNMFHDMRSHENKVKGTSTLEVRDKKYCVAGIIAKKNNNAIRVKCIVDSDLIRKVQESGNDLTKFLKRVKRNPHITDSIISSEDIYEF